GCGRCESVSELAHQIDCKIRFGVIETFTYGTAIAHGEEPKQQHHEVVVPIAHISLTNEQHEFIPQHEIPMAQVLCVRVPAHLLEMIFRTMGGHEPHDAIRESKN